VTDHIDPLQIVLQRVGRADPAKGAFFFWDEVKDWPAGILDILVAHGLLQPAQPMDIIECDGCEEKCIMPVAVYPTKGDKPGRAFITCDKHEDMGRIKVSFERMKQWRCSIDAVRSFIAAILGLRLNDNRISTGNLFEIGIATGNKRSQMLCLQADGELSLTAGNSQIPLAALIVFQGDSYSLDSRIIRQLVDASTTADERYTPSNTKREAGKLATQALYITWQKEYRKLKKKFPNKPAVWYAAQIAKLDIAKGRDSATIKKHMKS
jgi:hypothetical protein